MTHPMRVERIGEATWVEDGPALEFLEQRGWLEIKGWLHPPRRELKDDEWSAAMFLHEEWDYGIAAE
jgi:hypothetical protein